MLSKYNKRENKLQAFYRLKMDEIPATDKQF